MCIILLESPKSLSLRSLRFGPGRMLRIILLDFMLRASVAPQGFALDSSPRMAYLPAADPMEGDDRLGDAKSIMYYRYYSPHSAFLWRRPGLLNRIASGPNSSELPEANTRRRVHLPFSYPSTRESGETDGRHRF
jgi:hypothetical protein